MTATQLEKHIAVHLAYASEIAKHLSRLWNRPPTTSELSTIRSAMLCISFMSLESIERRLALADSSAIADEYFAFLRKEVDRHTTGVVADAVKKLDLTQDAPEASAFSDLLSWEEALLTLVVRQTD